MNKLGDFKLLLSIIATVIAMTVGSMVYFVPAEVFASFKADYEHNRMMRVKRDLRSEARECGRILKEYGSLTPAETEYCEEAEAELDDINQTIKLRWGK